MLIKDTNHFKKLANDGGKSIDYYENICRNPDGGTGYNVSSVAFVEELTADPNISVEWNVIEKVYHHEEPLDFLQYESQVATDELTCRPAIMNCILQGESEIAKGKKIRWRDVYRET